MVVWVNYFIILHVFVEHYEKQLRQWHVEISPNPKINTT